MAPTYDQMRELDTLIHHHVLSWEKFRDQPELYNGRLRTELWRRHRPGDTPPERAVWEFCNDPLSYSADIALAFQVVQAMNANGWSVEMKYGYSADTELRQDWQVSFIGQNNESGHSKDAKLPLAICNAALRAVAAHPECLTTRKGYGVP